MKRFQSRYEKIRRFRAQQERVAKSEAAARNADLENAAMRETQEIRLLDQVSRSAALQFEAGVSGAMLSALLNAVSKQQHSVTDAGAHRRLAEETAALAMNLYTTARTELNTIADVIHREQQEHRLQQRKHEDVQLQEQASQAWHQSTLNSEGNEQ
jgi:hypothetical protein